MLLNQSDIHFYGLLYISPENINTTNLKSTDNLNVYIKNALNLAKSLSAQGFSLKLITNDRKFIVEQVKVLPSYLDVVEIQFNLQVPSGIRFYSAHFKFEVFKFFSNLDVNYCSLLDLDVVCVNEFSSMFINQVKSKTPLVYDITAQLSQAYGPSVYRKDLSLLLDEKFDTLKWFGGEFICGNPLFFKRLTKEIDNIIPIYLKNINKLHHIGDEAVTTAALNCLLAKNEVISIMNGEEIIYRYWSKRPEHEQLPLKQVLQFTFLHLPSDKDFLAKNVTNDFTEFKQSYSKHVNSIQSKIINTYRIIKYFIS